MRVLQLTSMYPSAGAPYKGIFVRNQVESLEAIGVSSVVEIVDGPSSSLNYLKWIPKLRALLASGRFDLVHAHQGPTGLVPSFQFRVPFVLSLYGSDVHYRWARPFSAIAALRARRTIVCTRQMAEVLPRRVRPAILPPGIDIQHFRPRDRQEARARLGVAAGEKLLFFPADPERRIKDYPLFEAAVEHMSDPTIRIRVLRGVSEEDLPFLYAAADCLVLTSRAEGSPTVIKEALACGCPIVSVDVGDVSERVAGFEGCLVVEQRLPGAVAAAIRDVLASGARPDAGRATRELSLQAVARRVRAIYDECVSG